MTFGSKNSKLNSNWSTAQDFMEGIYFHNVNSNLYAGCGTYLLHHNVHKILLGGCERYIPLMMIDKVNTQDLNLFDPPLLILFVLSCTPILS